MTSMIFIPSGSPYTLALEPDYQRGTETVCKMTVFRGDSDVPIAELMLAHDEVLLLAGQLNAIDDAMEREAAKVAGEWQ